MSKSDSLQQEPIKKKSYTPARLKAIRKYLDTQAEIRVRVPKEMKPRYVNAAAAAGMSLNAFAVESMNEKIARDGLEFSVDAAAEKCKDDE